MTNLHDKCPTKVLELLVEDVADEDEEGEAEHGHQPVNQDEDKDEHLPHLNHCKREDI